MIGADDGGAARAVRTAGDDPIPTMSPLWLAVIGIEVLALLVYFGLTSATVTGLRYVLYPFVWINAGLWAVWHIKSPTGSPRQRGVAMVGATGYLVALLAITGMVGLTHGDATAGLQIRMASPGWGPLVSYLGPHVHFTLIPYRLAGYGALAYLVYAALLQTTRAAFSGVVGLASCISCSFSVILSLVGVITGGSTAAISTVYGASIDISTVVFLVTVGLLVWGIDTATKKGREGGQTIE